MKVPSDRRTSDPHYSPYPSSSSGGHTFQAPLPPSSHKRSNGPSGSSGGNTGGGGGGGRKSSVSSPGSKDDAGTQYKVARAISSCTRCRSRKQKCDGKLPACSACERANVECIGFDAISKTNISRNYLYSLEQEVASLRAQVAALTDENHDTIGQVKRGIARDASHAISSFHPALQIDPNHPSNQSDGSEPLRSPWDSPGFASRRPSEYAIPPTPLGGESPRSPYMSTRPPMPQSASSATSLTRMVHDAAYRTGHAQNPATNLQPAGNSSIAGSDRSVDSPAASGAVSNQGRTETQSPREVPTPKSPHKIPPPASPMATPSSAPSSGRLSRKRAFAIPPLPPQPAVERLVAAYVDFVGVTAPMIHIPTLGKQIIKIREGRDVEEGDVFVVMMVLALSTMASSRFVDPPDELRACSEAFHATAMKHLDAVFEEQTHVGLQAILLLVWYSLLNPDKGSIWFLVGLACRTCVDLGFHNERNAQKDNLDNLEKDMRRRLFWCVYKMDRLLSTSLGRPPTIPDGFINVPYPSEMHDVDIHAGSYGVMTGEPCSYKSVFLHTLKLRRIQSRILYHTYGIYLHESKREGPPEEWFDEMFDQLKQWLATTPEPRGTVSSEGFAISFHNSVLLLFRPSPGNPRPGKKGLQTVLASSSYIIRIYRRMQLNNRISWLWMTSHFSFMAGVSFLYAFFNLYSMGDEDGVPTLEEAQMDLESCQAVLAYLAPRVPSAAACHDTMQTLSKAILDQLSASDPPRVKSSTSPNRNIRSCAPVSSSRNDPLPNDRFPAPLPPVQLPYELSLLDNVFINPMAAHNKASDYTNGKQARANKITAKGVRQNGNTNGAGQIDSSGMGITNSASFSSNAPQGFPPGAFGGTIDSITNSLNGGNSGSGMNAMHAYAMAAQVNNRTLSPAQFSFPLGMNSNNGAMKLEDSNTSMNTGFNGMASGSGMVSGVGSGIGGNMGGTGGGGGGEGGLTNGDLVNAGMGTNNNNADPNNFDILNFLMDEEGGLGGTTTWDAMDVPADFSLWS